MSDSKCNTPRNLKHGHTRNGHFSPEYESWRGMNERCNNPNHNRYDLYGGRGIVVCERWRKFENFLEDMGLKPSPTHSIDRYPNKDGNYEPVNCRWATDAEQVRNNSRTHFIEHNGIRLCLTDWALRVGMKRNTLQSRLRLGWNIEDALNAPKFSR